MLHQLIGKLGLAYALHTPTHRGKFRVLNTLDRLFGPFLLRCQDGGFRMSTILSSSMDISYFRSEGQRAKGNIDHEALAQIRRLKRGEIYVDVGANSGFLVLHAAQRVGDGGKVIAFEPSLREFVRLIENVRMNDFRNVVCLNGALGERAAIAQFQVADHHTGLNKLAPAHANGVRAVSVPVLAGSDVLLGWLDRRPALLKIDVEGAELLVLQGMAGLFRRLPPRIVVVEITDQFLAEFGATREDIYRLMDGAGYKPQVRSSAAQFDEVFLHRSDVELFD